jgi:hypothetical protein
MFENGEIRTRVAQATRHRGILQSNGDTAEFPQDGRITTAGLPDHGVVGP